MLEYNEKDRKYWEVMKLKNYKKLGLIPLSTVLSFSILTPSVGAAPLWNEQQEQLQIRIAEVDSEVTKSDLVQRVKTLFPGKFDFLQEKDFEMSSGHYFPENDTIRYDLSFFKEVKGKQIYGSFGFVGEDLQIEYFYYQPADASDALFPPKVTKEEAQKAATAFLKSFTKDGEYQLDTVNDTYPPAQTLVEPIRYTFSFVRTEKQIPVSNQTIQITVLGNGEIVEFFRGYIKTGTQSFDDAKKVLRKEDVTAKVKANLAVDLRYKVDFHPQTGKPYVKLVYQPTGSIQGVNALTGQWQTAAGFSEELPADKGIQLIAAKPLAPRDPQFSMEKAKAFAEQMLAIDSEKVKLNIENVSERENQLGQKVISVQYMYETKDGGGYGAELIFDKQTGEIIQYFDIKRDLLRELGEKPESGAAISKAEAQDKAVQFLKDYVPSYLHDYSLPTDESYYFAEEGVYYFSFPREVDGILVDGDQIFVSISEDGSLVNLNADKLAIETWPSRAGIKSKDEAADKFKKGLNLELRYQNEENMEDNHYNLVYVPVYNGKIYSFIDAYTGEWNSTSTEDNAKHVSHSWAEKELNYLLQTGILEIEDPAKFNGNATISKGETIEMMMKSLTPIYSIYDEEQLSTEQSFENIGPEHPLYLYVERAVSMGILDPKAAVFDVDAMLTREELAFWYIRALGLEKAAQGDIYKLNFADADKVQSQFKGHVALANSYGILKGTTDGNFNPDQEVTYAQLAVSIVRLAKEAYERNPNR